MNQIYYSFIRLHMGLREKTPAEKAGVGIEERDKWLEILQRSTKVN